MNDGDRGAVGALMSSRPPARPPPPRWRPAMRSMSARKNWLRREPGTRSLRTIPRLT